MVQKKNNFSENILNNLNSFALQVLVLYMLNTINQSECRCYKRAERRTHRIQRVTESFANSPKYTLPRAACTDKMPEL